MGKRVVLLLLIFTYILMLGCSQRPAETAGSHSSFLTEGNGGITEAAQPSAENGPEESAADNHAPENTEETTPPEETAPPEQTTPPEEEILPEPISFWNPICNRYISFFASPESDEAFDRIPVNARIGLLKWEGRFARVIYGKQIGYVYAHCLRPADEDYFTDKLRVLTPTDKYTYAQMQTDMAKLKALYPQLISLHVIGQTEMRRDIPAMTVGNPDAAYHILVQAAMHGREHFTAWLAMAMVDYLLLQDNIPDDVCYHIIPMSNPDGVIISQTGKLEEMQWMIYEQDWNYGYTRADAYEYATQWKANAAGVDINRNFISGWLPSDDRPEQSSEKYRGIAPFSSPEAQALRDYTMQRTFHATISLHSHGSVLYYRYGTKETVNELSYSLAEAVEDVTGYIPTDFDNTTGAGYKDWAMDALDIPSLTVEIGGNYTPLDQQELYNTFDRCREMLPTVYQWVAQYWQ